MTGKNLLTSARIEIRTVDPTGRDAAYCLAAYFAELDRRSGTHYDPAAGVSAEPHELVPPAGAFLIAYHRDEPIGCGAVKHHARAATEIKRMWVAESVRGLGIGRRLLVALEACATAGRRARSASGDQRCARRGDRDVPLRRIRRGRAVQRRAVCRALVRKAPAPRATSRAPRPRGRPAQRRVHPDRVMELRPKARHDQEAMGFLHRDDEPAGTRYRMREKLLSIGDDFWIETEAGERAFKVDGKALRVREARSSSSPRRATSCSRSRSASSGSATR